MAFTTVDKQGRILLPKELLHYSEIKTGRGVSLYLVNMNDDGTEFDIVSEDTAHGNDTCIDAIVNSDEKSRLPMLKAVKGIEPGSNIKITACKGRLHLKVLG